MTIRKIIALWLIALIPALPFAATRTWDGGHATSPNWTEASNWSDDTAPTNADAVVFDATSTDSCYVNANVGWASLTTTSAVPINFGSSIDTSNGHVKIGSTALIYSGTSKILFNGTATDSMRCGGKTFYDIEVNKGGGTFYNKDKITCRNFDLNAGILYSAQPIEYSGDMALDGSGNDLTLYSTYTGTGASGTFHIGSGVGTVAATIGNIVMNGKTGMTFDDDKGVYYFATLMLGDSAKVSVTGGARTTFSNSSEPLVRGNYSTLTIGGASASFYLTGSDSFFRAGTGSVINGTGIVDYCIDANGVTAVIPTYTYTGTGTHRIYEANGARAGSVYTLGGAFNVGDVAVGFRSVYNGTTATLNFNDKNVTCGLMTIGSQQPTATLTINYGSGTHNIGGYDNQTYNGAGGTTHNLNSSTINFTGDLKIGSNHKFSSGTSTVNFAKTTGVQVFKNDGDNDSLYAIGKTGAGAMICSSMVKLKNDATLSDGTMRLYYGIDCGGNLSFAGNDTAEFRTNCNFRGNNKTITLGANAIPELATCSLNVLGDKINLVNNSASPMVVKKLFVNAGDTVCLEGTNTFGIRTDRVTAGASSVLKGATDAFSYIISPLATADITLDATTNILNSIIIMSEAAAITLPAITTNNAPIMVTNGVFDGTTGHTTQATRYTLGGNLTIQNASGATGLLTFTSYDFADTIDCETYNTTSDILGINNWNAQTVVYLGSGNHRTRGMNITVYDNTTKSWPDDGVQVFAESCTWDSIENIGAYDLATGNTIPKLDKLFVNWGTSTAYCDPHDNMHLFMWGKGYPHIVTNGTPYLAWYDTVSTVDTIARFQCGGDSIIWPYGRTVFIRDYTAGDWNGTAGNLTTWRTGTGMGLTDPMVFPTPATNDSQKVTLNIPAVVPTVSYMRIGNCPLAAGDSINASNGTNISLGGN